ncbi:MAG: protease inhibitor I42 family protein [Solirubrobacteraceae bacterium]
MAVGEEHRLPLSSLAMAGYRWSGSVKGPDPGAVELELRRDAPSPGVRAGESAPESAVLRGVRPGLAVVHLEQRRPWERDKPPADLIELRVVVGA